MRILLAEDECSLADVISKRLKREGYAVDTVYDGETAYDFLEGTEYDIALLDIMMPKMDGLEVIGRYRASGGSAPVIFITAKDALSDRVDGLDAGADDYIIKPFSFDELLARIRSVLRRAGGGVKSNMLRVEDLTLDISSGIVKRGGRTIELSGKEYALLKYMMSNADMILSRDAILSHVWDYSYEGQSNMVDVYIRYLRKKIDGFNERPLIHTFRGRGYMIGGRIG